MAISTLLTQNQSRRARIFLKEPFPLANSFSVGTAFAASLSGAWWLLRQDGTNEAGAGQTLTAVGAPSAGTTAFGANQVTARRLDGVDDGYKTPDVASPVGAFTLLVLVRKANNAGILIGRDSHEANARAMYWAVNAAGNQSVELYKTNASSTVAAGGSAMLDPDVWHLGAVTFNGGADGAASFKLYRDKVLVGSSATAVSPMQAAASTFWGIGHREFSGFQDFLAADIALALFTEAELSLATISAIYDHLFGLAIVSSASITKPADMDVRFTFTPSWSTPTTDRYLVDALASNNGTLAFIRGTDGAILVRSGNGAGTNDTATAGLSWTASQAYAIRLLRKAGAVSIYRDGSLLQGPVNRNVPTELPSTIGIGSSRTGTLLAGGTITGFTWR